MTLSPVTCTIYANGSYTPGCQAAINHAAPQGLPLEFIPILAVPGVIFGIMFITRWYWEYPFGRFFYHKKGIKAVGYFAGAPSVLGTLEPFEERFFLFTSSGKRKERITRLVAALPGAMAHLRQKDGGDSFALVDLDKGATVNPEVQEWAEKNLNELAESHDWPTFALRTKLKMITADLADLGRFPALGTLKPDAEIWVPREVLTK